MKPLCFAACMFITTIVNSQTDSSGVYQTVRDFKENRLTYATACRGKKQTRDVDYFFKAKYKGAEIKQKKREVFGYRSCEGKSYRLFEDTEFQILNVGTIPLYSQKRIRNKSSDLETLYYFSRELNNPIIPLTIENLKNAFPDNHKFHDMLDERCKSDEDLIQFDKRIGKHKVIHLYEESKLLLKY